ncbi:acetyl-CoA carboxylase biotin carboxylase subunit [Aquamicrobium zhengzhouense]|uniref:Biotin carboxylase n=1 Tax=Aquamicrobium zhengzhouense TaxID=2781738 RepID=A0ABS0SGY1_9HYPH|nr:biotin carboxylase N-terminal domain-containing protein [Aquamicrobium zhengzhouense]MBI1621668.1 biotin carboxylase [Aquamicrobium zhengzhouense]
MISEKHFRRILIANRGAAASRLLRGIHALGREAVVIYSPADADLPYVAKADHAVALEGNRPSEGYLDQDAILEAARESGADAIHPGWGFLSENPTFAQRVVEAGLSFIGPSAEVIAIMGEKTRARTTMADAGLPMVPSSDLLSADPTEILNAGDALGYPLLVKPANGGGGIGMTPVHDRDQLVDAVSRARAVAQRAFGDDEVFLERLLVNPRHIEFQIAADQTGASANIFERDCSVQRRHQKVLEEAPAPRISRSEVDAMGDRVAIAVSRIGYHTVGTVEMLYHPDVGFSFLEMNTRLQVEHGVTEDVTGIDLVAVQIRLAEGARLADVLDTPRLNGTAIEARIYAEDPVRFLPSPGQISTLDFPAVEGVRIESGYVAGNRVTPFYDPMVAKVIASANDRQTAIKRLREALAGTTIEGIKTNIPSLIHVLDSSAFREGRVHTGMIAELGKAN